MTHSNMIKRLKYLKHKKETVFYHGNNKDFDRIEQEISGICVEFMCVEENLKCA